MTEYDQELINELKSNISCLIEIIEKSKKELIRVKDENKALELQIDVYKKELDKLNQQYENLKVAKILSADNEDKEPARQRINKLVREIDKCIALLNN